MISLLKSLLGSRPDALAATSPWAQTAQPLSASRRGPYEPWRDSPGVARRRARLAAERSGGRS